MKVILYIGHHKVGSTALQVFLTRNWARLARLGILYPSTDHRGYAHNMRQLLERPPLKVLPAHIREPHNALAYRMIADVSRREIPSQFGDLPSSRDMLERMQHQVAALMPHTVILCAEAFANFGEVSPELISQLCDSFSGADFTLYCALRRPDDYLASWHGQRIKVGELVPPLRNGGLRQYLRTIHFNYRTVVEPWVQRVPQAQVLLRNYKDVVTAGGSVEDFTACCQLSLPEDLIPPGRSNPSLPLAAFALMERANTELAPLPRHNLSLFLQAHAPALSPVANRDVEVFGAAQRAELLEAFRPHEAYLAGQTGQPQFFADLEEIARPRPVPDQDAARQLLDAIDPESIPHPIPRAFIRALKGSFSPCLQT
jgi:hypothetical protein